MANRHRNDFVKITDGKYCGKRLIDIAIVDPKFILEFDNNNPGVASIELIDYCKDEVLLNEIILQRPMNN